MIGINSFQNPEAQGINFAVSVKDVRSFLSATTSRKLDSPPSFKEMLKDADSWTVDSNGDGNDDTTLVDIDHNGKPEMAIIDESADGEADYILLDENENGVAEIKILGENSEYAGLWLIDEDEDGDWDQAATDEDGDGELDRFEPIN